MKPFSIIVLVALLLTAAISARAADVTLAWDPVPDPDVAGYKLYYGPWSRFPANDTIEYMVAVDVGKPDPTEFTIRGLEPGITYHFAATAYDEAGNESAYSNEVIWKAPTTVMDTEAPGEPQNLVLKAVE